MKTWKNKARAYSSMLMLFLTFGLPAHIFIFHHFSKTQHIIGKLGKSHAAAAGCKTLFGLPLGAKVQRPQALCAAERSHLISPR